MCFGGKCVPGCPDRGRRMPCCRWSRSCGGGQRKVRHMFQRWHRGPLHVDMIRHCATSRAASQHPLGQAARTPLRCGVRKLCLRSRRGRSIRQDHRLAQRTCPTGDPSQGHQPLRRGRPRRQQREGSLRFLSRPPSDAPAVRRVFVGEVVGGPRNGGGAGGRIRGLSASAPARGESGRQRPR